MLARLVLAIAMSLIPAVADAAGWFPLGATPVSGFLLLRNGSSFLLLTNGVAKMIL